MLLYVWANRNSGTRIRDSSIFPICTSGVLYLFTGASCVPHRSVPHRSVTHRSARALLTGVTHAPERRTGATHRSDAPELLTDPPLKFSGLLVWFHQKEKKTSGNLYRTGVNRVIVHHPSYFVGGLRLLFAGPNRKALSNSYEQRRRFYTA